MKEAAPSIEKGVDTIKSYLKVLPDKPGVYRMISSFDEVLYVGKAKALKKRVSSYTHLEKLPYRLQNMVSLTSKMEFITTHTEADALLLEANLIKKLKPRYNILLRDDKSFPYILIDQEHDFPKVTKHRGARKKKGLYFGPFPSAGDVNRSITILQRVFLLRNCSDNVFKNRDRPCLQYHIKRCTAPCVSYVGKQEYADQVKGARDFMQGKSRAVQEQLAEVMHLASNAQDYEKAALYRDRIRVLSSVQASSEVDSDDIGDADVIAIKRLEGVSCIQVFFYRSGRNLGNYSYFPRHAKDDSEEDIISAFLSQYYQNKMAPKQIILNVSISDKAVYEEALSEKDSHAVNILFPQKGKYKKTLEFVIENAQQALERHQALSASRRMLQEKVADIFGLDASPKRIEVYDNSHISGTNMVGAMVVEGEEGFIKNAYRKFNIKYADKADDYGMMREVMQRRFRKASKGDDANGWPDLLLIDGGSGQLNACCEVLEHLGVLGDLCIVGIAKGADRDAGREKFFMQGREVFQLPVNDPVLHYLQRLRDEAHRFAIGSHRIRRNKDISKSPLDEIDGIGAGRKKALLAYFGSAKAVDGAGVDDIAKVEGISRATAQNIYDFFHKS